MTNNMAKRKGASKKIDYVSLDEPASKRPHLDKTNDGASTSSASSTITVVDQIDNKIIKPSKAINKFAYRIWIYHTNIIEICKKLQQTHSATTSSVLYKVTTAKYEHFIEEPYLRNCPCFKNFRFENKFYENLFYMAVKRPFNTIEEYGIYGEYLKKHGIMKECCIDLSKNNKLLEYISQICKSIEKKKPGTNWCYKLANLSKYITDAHKRHEVKNLERKQTDIPFEDFLTKSNVLKKYPLEDRISYLDMYKKFIGARRSKYLMDCRFGAIRFDDDHWNKKYLSIPDEKKTSVIPSSINEHPETIYENTVNALCFTGPNNFDKSVKKYRIGHILDEDISCSVLANDRPETIHGNSEGNTTIFPCVAGTSNVEDKLILFQQQSEVNEGPKTIHELTEENTPNAPSVAEPDIEDDDHAEIIHEFTEENTANVTFIAEPSNVEEELIVILHQQPETIQNKECRTMDTLELENVLSRNTEPEIENVKEKSTEIGEKMTVEMVTNSVETTKADVMQKNCEQESEKEHSIISRIDQGLEIGIIEIPDSPPGSPTAVPTSSEVDHRFSFENIKLNTNIREAVIKTLKNKQMYNEVTSKQLDGFVHRYFKKYIKGKNKLPDNTGIYFRNINAENTQTLQNTYKTPAKKSSLNERVELLKKFQEATNKQVYQSSPMPPPRTLPDTLLNPGTSKSKSKKHPPAIEPKHKKQTEMMMKFWKTRKPAKVLYEDSQPTNSNTPTTDVETNNESQNVRNDVASKNVCVTTPLGYGTNIEQAKEKVHDRLTSKPSAPIDNDFELLLNQITKPPTGTSTEFQSKFSPPYSSTQHDEECTRSGLAPLPESPITAFDSENPEITVLPVATVVCNDNAEGRIGIIKTAENDPLSTPIKTEKYSQNSSYTDDVEFIPQTDATIVCIDDSSSDAEAEDLLAKFPPNKNAKMMDTYMQNKADDLFLNKENFCANTQTSSQGSADSQTSDKAVPKNVLNSVTTASPKRN